MAAFSCSQPRALRCSLRRDHGALVIASATGLRSRATCCCHRPGEHRQSQLASSEGWLEPQGCDTASNHRYSIYSTCIPHGRRAAHVCPPQCQVGPQLSQTESHSRMQSVSAKCSHYDSTPRASPRPTLAESARATRCNKCGGSSGSTSDSSNTGQELPSGSAVSAQHGRQLQWRSRDSNVGGSVHNESSSYLLKAAGLASQQAETIGAWVNSLLQQHLGGRGDQFKEAESHGRSKGESSRTGASLSMERANMASNTMAGSTLARLSGGAIHHGGGSFAEHGLSQRSSPMVAATPYEWELQQVLPPLAPDNIVSNYAAAPTKQDLEQQQQQQQQQQQPLLPRPRVLQHSSGGPQRPPITNLLLHVLVACIGAYLYGYHLSVANGPLDTIAQELGFAGSAVAKGSVVSTFLVGAFLGCTISSTTADGIGRRRSFQATALPILLGSCVSAMSSSLPAMLMGRFLVGVGLGLGSPLTSLYISEISPAALRGTLNSLPQVAACVGILLALLMGVQFPELPLGWRGCFWCGAVPAATLVFLSEYIADSPRWLAQRGRWSEAEKALELLRGASSSSTAALAAKAELLDLKATSAHADAAATDTTSASASASEVSWSALFARPYRRVVLLGCGLFMLQQLSGINSVFYFSSSIFKAAGVTSEFAASMALGGANLAAALMSTVLMDRAGRKTLLFGSFSAMAAALGLQVLTSLVPGLSWAVPTVSLATTLLYVMAFAFGAGPVPALLLPEIFPTPIRARGMAVSICVHWVFNFIIGFAFLPLLEIFGSACLSSFFASVCLLAAIFTEYAVVETKGKSLEEIEALMHSDGV